MTLIYTNVPPLTTSGNQETIAEAFQKLAGKASKIEIATGYVSVDGLEKLDQTIKKNNIGDIMLIAGMYRTDGIPESIYHQATNIHKRWTDAGIGSINFVNNMNYHGKSYLFYSHGKPFAAIIGSANLGALAETSNNSRQYELATIISDSQQLYNLQKHISSVLKTCTSPADTLGEFKIVHERIDALSGTYDISEISNDEQEKFLSSATQEVIKIPIKAPEYKERLIDDGKHYTVSNINVCYHPRKNKSQKATPRNWFEAQIGVPHAIYQQGLPKQEPFFIITDDGYKFEVCTSGQRGKQLSAYSNEASNDRVFGRWIKGRLAQAGYVKPIDNVAIDTTRKGIISNEMLKAAKMSTMVLTKTTKLEYGYVFERLEPTEKQREHGDKGSWNKKFSTMQPLPVWLARFE